MIKNTKESKSVSHESSLAGLTLMQWHLEKVGENRFKSKNCSSGVMFSVHPVDKQQCEVSQEETEWFIEPTDVDGEYTYVNIHPYS